MEIKERLFEEKLQGHCCSQTIMNLYLQDKGLENDGLVAAMRAFCHGMHEGKICGTLAAAVCVLYLADAEAAEASLRGELMDWFFDRYGGYDCYELIGDDDIKRMTECPVFVEETYLKLEEMLDL
jgi:hypothetical protein